MTGPMLGSSTRDGQPAPLARFAGEEDGGAGKISITAAMAGFYFSFRAILVLMSARWLNVGTTPGVGASLLFALLLLMWIAFQSIGPEGRQVGWLRRTATMRWVSLYLAFSCCSLLWSATASPLASFLYWCGMAADVLSVVLLFRIYPVGQVAQSMMRGFVWSTCLLAAIAWTMPAESDLRLGDLNYFNTNQIGNLCALGIFAAQFIANRTGEKWQAAQVLLMLTLLRSLSKATLAAFAVSQLYVLIGNRRTSARKKAVLVFAWLLVLAVFWGLFADYYSIYTTEGNQAETLTGRTAIWAYTLDAALQRPWIGNGIDSMWKVFPPFGNEMFEARHAENELVQQFFAYGLVGIGMLAGIYGSLWRAIRRYAKEVDKPLLTGIVLFVLIRGLAEAEPFDLLLPLWMITLLSATVAYKRDGAWESVRSTAGLPVSRSGASAMCMRSLAK